MVSALGVGDTAEAQPRWGLRPLLAWAGAAAVAVPVGIVLHELGHYLVAAALGAPDLHLHYDHISANEAVIPAGERGAIALAGPIVTLLIVVGFSAAALRSGPRALLIAPVFAAGWRTAGLTLGYWITRVAEPAALAGRDVDELIAARSLGVPAEVLYAVNALVLYGAWVLLVRRVPRGRRLPALTGILLGTAVGIIAWLRVLGPVLLP